MNLLPRENRPAIVRTCRMPFLTIFVILASALTSAAASPRCGTLRTEIEHDTGCEYIWTTKICTTSVFGIVDSNPSHELVERLLTPFHEDTAVQRTMLGTRDELDTLLSVGPGIAIGDARTPRQRKCPQKGWGRSFGSLHNSGTTCVARDCMSPECAGESDKYADCLTGCRGLDQRRWSTSDSIHIDFDCRWSYNKPGNRSEYRAKKKYFQPENSTRRFRMGDSLYFETTFQALLRDSSVQIGP